MLEIIKLNCQSDLKSLLKRPSLEQQDLSTLVKDIIEQVRTGGDSICNEFNAKFDRVHTNSLELDAESIRNSALEIDPQLKSAIEQAYKNIYKFHLAQVQEEITVSTYPGVVCKRKSVAIEKVGLYIPGGSAPLFSTILMLAIPAQIAGCKEIILCTPPAKSGKLNSAMAYVIEKVGITKVFQIGGAQAIAAMAIGTESIPKVDKILGPGNQYVTLAKQLIQQEGVAIDMPAGPSEVAIIADQNANAAFIAADLLSQAEHGADSQVLLITNSQELANKVNLELSKQIELLTRKDIAILALQNSKSILVSSLEEAIQVSNYYAPEHLIIQTANPNELVPNIINAGSVFLGPWTPEAIGDYASGTNHTLPTNGWSRSYSGVSIDTFVKKITIQELSYEGLASLGPLAALMADAEGLDAHKNALEIRYKTTTS